MTESDHILFFTPTKKYIEFSYAIRKGICENCGKSKAKSEISVTNLHHKNNKYDLEKPLWNTIEVCLECHEKLDPRLKAFKKNQRYWFGSNAHKMRCSTCQVFAIFGNEGSGPDHLSFKSWIQVVQRLFSQRNHNQGIQMSYMQQIKIVYS